MSEPSPAAPSRLNRFAPFLLLAGVLLVALLPWWRNHPYLRDFYDYGLVMSGVGRIEAGERPYVDFITPIQTGLFLFNGWAEKLGGGTFQAMTRGLPVLALLSVLGLAAVLARRWPVWLAGAMTAAWTCMTVAQHTIIWHNPVGAICIAIAACGAAVAPVLRREQWPWHLLVGLALAVGGITKLNAQLVAMCGVTAWALLAGFSRRAPWTQVAATLGFVFVCGVLIPFGFELAWTHASPAVWWHNVVALPFGSRSGDLGEALHWKFYFNTRHDYYGPMPVKQLGFVGLAVTAAFVVQGIRSLGWRQAGWLVAAALFAAASGAGLLATNYEIAYVAMGAWFALVASLWLGFGLRCAGGWFYGGLVGPTLAVGAIAWSSAWQGQRSQFGHESAPRSKYIAGEDIGGDFGYLRGTRLPPGIVSAMTAMAAWRAQQPASEQAAVFYGPALEWLERPWPVTKVHGLPLWRQGGTTYGPREEARLLWAVSVDGPYRHVLVPEAWNYWDPGVTAALTGKYMLERPGGVWFRYDKVSPELVARRPIHFIEVFGGSTNGRFLAIDGEIHTGNNGRSFIGVRAGRGTLHLTAPTNRLQGQVVLRRYDPAFTGPLAADFSIMAEVDAEHRYLRWSQHVELAAGQEEKTIDYAIDSSHLPTGFYVDIAPEQAGKVVAGWRGPSIQHAGEDGPAAPVWLQGGNLGVMTLRADEIARLFPPGTEWLPEQVFVRGGRVAGDGLELDPGGELWIRVKGFATDFSGTAYVLPERDLSRPPMVRSIWVKDARLEVYSPGVVSLTDRSVGFRSWSAEPGGWLVLAADPIKGAPVVSLRINRLLHKDWP